MTIIYVVMWRYGDASGFGTVSAHPTEQGAQKMLGILQEHCNTKQFYIAATPYEPGGA